MKSPTFSTFAPFLLLTACGASEPDALTAASERPTREVTANVDEILDTYAKNQIAGERKYGDAKMLISGEALRVREALGTGILEVGSSSGKAMDLYFAEEGEADIAAVEPGQKVQVTCYAIIEIMGNVAASDCTDIASP